MSALSQQNNKRIAKNTLLLYFRMLFMMAVNLYTSRVILVTLGVEDYGIYNVVGGAVTMFSFINSAMTGSTQRFITFALGRGEEKELSKVFSMSVIIHGIISLVIILLAETIGLWFFYHKMIIPIERMDAAFWVFQFAVLTAVVMIMSVPYNAVIIAHEKMGAFAYISVLEVILKLIIVYVLVVFHYDKLKLYVVLTFIIQIFVCLVYSTYCKKHFRESHFVWTRDKKLFSRMLLFAGWTMNGNLAVMGYTQGLNLLLNMFFNPVVNAARGLAVQVQLAVSNFCRNFQMALNPQITKSYAIGDYSYMHELVFASSRYSFYLLFLLSFPVFLESRFILSIWLGIVPDYTIPFVRIMLIITLCNALSNPMIVSVHATGKIKRFQMLEGGVLLLIFPVAYLCLKLGMLPRTVFIVHLMIEIIAQFVRVWVVCPMIKMNKHDYLINVIKPILKVSFCSSLVPIGLYLYLPSHLYSAVFIILSCPLCTLIMVYLNLSVVEKRILKRKYMLWIKSKRLSNIRF